MDIDNIGGLAAPFDLELTYSDGSTQSVHQTPAVWMADQKHARVLIHTSKTLREASLVSGIFMDADTTNNRWTSH